jgi:hypothetical protein
VFEIGFRKHNKGLQVKVGGHLSVLIGHQTHKIARLPIRREEDKFFVHLARRINLPPYNVVHEVVRQTKDDIVLVECWKHSQTRMFEFGPEAECKLETFQILLKDVIQLGLYIHSKERDLSRYYTYTIKRQ